MLREWIKNIPLAVVEEIYASGISHGNIIWRLAADELNRRQRQCA